MKIPETAKACLFEKEKWEQLIVSADWVAYRNALKEHQAYLQKEVNEHLRNQRFTDAFGSLRAMDDSNKFLDSINKRIKELEKGANNGNNA